LAGVQISIGQIGGIEELVGLSFEVPEKAETARATTTANTDNCFFISFLPRWSRTTTFTGLANSNKMSAVRALISAIDKTDVPFRKAPNPATLKVFACWPPYSIKGI
jgi:hypothetical protein